MKTDRSPAFQFYAKDWRDVKVRRMSLAAQGAYISILADMWVDSQDQCSILDCQPFIAKSLGISLDEWLTLRSEIQHAHEPLLVEENGRLYSVRLSEEVKKQRKFRKLQSEKGKRSAEVRSNRGSTTVQPDGQPKVNSSSSSSSSLSSPDLSSPDLSSLPSLTSKDNLHLRSKSYTEEFEKFWVAYPNKVGKKEAFKSWVKAKDRPPITELLSKIEVAKHTEKWTKDNGQFIPNPATWLNQGRWADEPTKRPQSTMEAFLSRQPYKRQEVL